MVRPESFVLSHRRNPGHDRTRIAESLTVINSEFIFGKKVDLK
jgi:hypothetical protein